MARTRPAAAPPRLQVLAAFAAVYLIWGSTYLGIRIAIETMPPLLMAGLRFVTAGSLLYGWLRLRGAPRPRALQWRAAAIVGALLLLICNGCVVCAEQVVPSSLAALILASVPLWMVLLDWLRPGGQRPGAVALAGVALGMAGLALLVGQDGPAGLGRSGLVGALAILLGSFSWALGSLYSRDAPLPDQPLMGTAMEMLVGGALLMLAGLVLGDGARLNLAGISLRSGLALGYLIAFGSLIGYSAYTWLVRVVPVAHASSYAYVNPVVAVFLGWALAGEPLTARTLVAAAIVIVAVVLITASRPARA